MPPVLPSLNGFFSRGKLSCPFVRTPCTRVVRNGRSCGGPNFIVVCRHFVVGGAAYANIVVIIFILCIVYAVAVSLASAAVEGDDVVDDRLDADDGPGLPPSCPIRVDAVVTRGRPPFAMCVSCPL